MSVVGSAQSSVPEPEPEPEPLPEPLPLPLPPPQSAAHVPPFSPFVVSHMPSPHTADVIMPQSSAQFPISLGAHTLSPQTFWAGSLPLPLPVSSSPDVDSAHANARAIARAQKIPALILIMAPDGTRAN